MGTQYLYHPSLEREQHKPSCMEAFAQRTSERQGKEEGGNRQGLHTLEKEQRIGKLAL